MEEKSLIKAALLTSTIGLVLLFFYAQEVSLPTLQSLEDSHPQEHVIIEGRITKITQTDTVLFITLEGMQVIKTDVILFPEENIFLVENRTATIEGIVEEYRGKKEVIAHKITLK